MEQQDFHLRTGAHSHQVRCKKILEKHPEVAQLIGRNPWTFVYMIGFVGMQLAIAAWLGGLGFANYWWLALIVAYCIGAFPNHSLYVVIHDATHNMIFKSRLLNKICVVLSDIPNVVPGAMGFSTYHMRHHSHLGDYENDTDLATHWEAKLIGNVWWRKALWMLLFPFFQIFRTERVKAVTTWKPWMFVNIAFIIATDVAIYYFFGFNALFYLFFSMIFALGLHPLGARWIQEHYTLNPYQETYSYYGPLNKLALNIGYHNEHHDFPSIPWNRLPKLKKMAPEFYDNLEYHPSWSKLLWTFIFNKDYSLYSRVRKN